MIAGQTERLSKLSADEATAKTHAGDPITIGGRTYPREDIAEILGGKLDALPKNVPRRPRAAWKLSWPAFLESRSSRQFPPGRVSRRVTTRQTMLSRDHQGPRAVLNGLERLAGGYGSDCDRVRQDLAIAEAQLRDYQARLGKPFTLDSYLCELTALRDQLKTGLSSGAHEPGKEKGPSTSELANRIKSLKAAHSIDATPQRVRQKHSTAEEPITARILRKEFMRQTAADMAAAIWEKTADDASTTSTNQRRRNHQRINTTNTASDPVIQPDDALGAEDATAARFGQDSSTSQQLTFQERIAMERQRKDDGPSPP